MIDYGHDSVAREGSIAPPYPILICLLGSFRVLKAGGTVSIRMGGKTETLLAYLGLRTDERVTRETLAQLLWPDSDRALANHSLRSLLHTLQSQLGDAITRAPPCGPQ